MKTFGSTIIATIADHDPDYDGDTWS